MKVLLVEDDPALGEALVEAIGEATHWVRDAGAAMLAIKEQPDLILSDIHLGTGPDGYQVLGFARQHAPGTPVVLMTAFSDVDGAVRALQQGAADYLAKPFKVQTLKDVLAKHLRQASGQVIAQDPASKQVLSLAKRIASSTASVFVTGESGTGKEVLCRYIHDHSPRAEQPFVAVNCAAIPENMLEATLFGYEKGAFTGALKSLPGKFEQADGGTLLLDEITEMAPELQAKLLRVLQEREVERLGSVRAKSIDVRVIATTNRDPQQAIDQGFLRSDLYYRLNVMPLAWLPLNQRRADILPLAESLLAKHARQSGVSCPAMTAAVQHQLAQHDWPGNIRELDNCMHRALVLSAGAPIETDHTLLTPVSEPASDLKSQVQATEHQQLLHAIELAGGNKTEASKALGISPRTLRHKLAKYKAAGLT